jgi:RND superfamily putative drug exporter
VDLFARLALRWPRRTLGVAGVLFIVSLALGVQTPRLLGHASNDFVAQGSESVRAENAAERASHLSATPQLVVLVRDPTPARLALVKREVGAEPVFRILAPPVRARDGRSALVAAYARAGVSESVWRTRAQEVWNRLRPTPGVFAGGTALATIQVNSQVQRDLRRAEELAFPILFLLALLVFRGVVAALLPIAVGAVTIAGSLVMLRGLDQLTPISTYALNIVVGAGLGLGIDYSLLLVSRYREELARTGPGAEAVRATLRTAGRTVAFSSITVGAAIATLTVFPLGFLRSMGIAGGLVGPLAGLISLTVLPPLFFLLGERVNALSVRDWRRVAKGERGGWYRLAQWIMRRPIPVALAASTVLIVAALPFLNIRFTGIDASVLPPSASSRIVDAAVQHDFPVALTTPAYAVLHGTAADAQRWVARVRRLPETRMISKPLPLGPGVWEVRASSGAPFLAHRSLQLVNALRAQPGGALVGGASAQFLDQKHAIGSYLPYAIALICLSTYILLWLATRSMILPLKTLIMNALTLGATFGILVFVFQDGRLEGLLGYRGQGALQLTQPVLLFAIAFGLATDYGVFLLTRIKEARESGLSNREAIAMGLERTGRIVTAAAALFCIAVGAFATSRIIVIKEVGVGIALAVAIDATIVRAFLVPSLMAILGRWNWWPSRFSEAQTTGAPPRSPRQTS